MSSGSLVTHNYSNFRGVDFTEEEVSINRSPDALNMWKNYRQLGKCLETRPDIELVKKYNFPVFGFFFYKVGNTEMTIVHSGVYLYRDNVQIYSGMIPRKSTMFVYNNILYVLDGANFVQFDGVEVKPVTGFTPTTTIAMKPSGAGTTYQNVNLLNPLRINTFIGDGESTEFKLDAQGAIDNDYRPKVKVNDESVETFSVNYTNGTITFTSAPPKPLSEGVPNVEIEFKRTIAGYRDRITHCTKAIEFDNRIFFTGNPDYPTTIFYSELNTPGYVSDINYQPDGNDQSPINGMVVGNDALWVFREPNIHNTGVYYHQPTTTINALGEAKKEYVGIHSSIELGCVADAVNFNDDIVFFSNRGMEAISKDITNEQFTTHRSSLVDRKLLSEDNYKKLILGKWEGYLMVMIDNHIYLANSNEDYSNYGRYEWFYWEIKKTPLCTITHDNVLYIGCDDGIYSFTDWSKKRKVTNYWTTTYDEFGYPQYQKQTNKRGSVIDAEGENIRSYISVDNKEFELSKIHTDVKGYAVNKIKKKKWKGIQIKFYSTKPMKFYSCTLEAYIGGYIKR